MVVKLDRALGERFLQCVEDYKSHDVKTHLFHYWWNVAPVGVIETYVAVIENDPELSAYAEEGWYAPRLDMDELARCAPGSLGHAYHEFMSAPGVAPDLIESYDKLFDDLEASGEMGGLSPTMRYMILRGHQTHDIHHVLTGYPATPAGEIGINTFKLAQMNTPFYAMWTAVLCGHMTFADPSLTEPVMDAMAEGWTYGRRARNIQFVPFEKMYDRPLEDIRQEFGLRPGGVRKPVEGDQTNGAALPIAA